MTRKEAEAESERTRLGNTGPAKDTVAISKVWRSPKIYEGQNKNKARRETKSSRKQDKSRDRREHTMSPVNRALTTKNLPRSRVLSSNTQKVTRGEHNRRLPIGWGFRTVTLRRASRLCRLFRSQGNFIFRFKINFCPSL